MFMFRKPALALAGVGSNVGQRFDKARVKTLAVSKGVARELRTVQYHTVRGMRQAVEVLVVNLAFLGLVAIAGYAGMVTKSQIDADAARAHLAAVVAEEDATRHSGDILFARPQRMLSDLLKKKFREVEHRTHH